MREYKFRGKEADSREWVYGGLFKEPAPPQCFEKNLEDKYWIVYPDPRYMPDWNLPYKMVRTDVEKETIGQYTGLKDKNGKEIYEGDIIFIKGETKLLDIKGKVEYSNILAQFIITNTGNIVNEAESLGDYEEEDIEKIGNVYDNPELLEEGE